MNFGLSASAIENIKKTLSQHPEITRAQIFGSRALGNYQSYSDIDLVLWGDIDEFLLAKIYAELDELPIAQKFDVVVYQQITHIAFREHIDKYGKDI